MKLKEYLEVVNLKADYLEAINQKVQRVLRLYASISKLTTGGI